MKNFLTFENVSKWPEGKNRHYYIISISLFLKILLLMSDNTVNNDGLLYIAAAQKFAAGHFNEWLKAFPMPFYPMLIGIVHFLISDWVTAARTISIIFIVFTIIPVYLLTKELFDRKAAFWASLAFALAPFPNSLADTVIRDPGFIFFIAWAIYFALRTTQTQEIYFLCMTALFSIFSILFRIEGIILIIFFPVYLLVLYFIEEQKRTYLLKRSVLLIMIPLFLVTVFFIFGLNKPNSFNRSGEIYSEIKRLFNIGFLDSYYAISDNLKTLEQSSPVSGFKNNFAEIARHYMHLIYLVGLIESFIIVLFPLYLLPLFFSFNRTVQTNRVFVSSVFLIYMLMVYYFLVKMDFITSRYLSVPLLLVYPWIGAGIQRFFEYLAVKFPPKVFALFFLIFFILPVYKCVEQEFNEDRSLMAAAKWVADKSDEGKLRIITTDNRFLFYSGRDYYAAGNAFFVTGGDELYNFDNNDNNYRKLEQVAIQKKFDLVLIRISSKKEAPQFEYFKKLREFKGRKNISYIFSSP